MGSVALVLLVGAGLVALLTVRARPGDGPWYALAFALHMAASFALVWVVENIYGAGDMTLYHYEGVYIGRALEVDFATAFPEVVALLFHQPSLFEPDIVGAGSSGGTVSAITGLISFVLGESMIAISLAFSLAAFLGSVALYEALVSTLGTEVRRDALLAAFFVPSAVYWSSGVVKEAIVMAALGFLVLGTARALNGRVIIGAILVGLGALPVALAKPYVLFAYVVAAGVWTYADRTKESGGALLSRPLYLAAGAGLAVGGLLLLGQIFPAFAIDQWAEEAARLQAIGAARDGGSNYQIGDPAATSFIGQLAFAPLALASALFRPLAIEVTNATMAVSAVETTLILGLLGRGLWLNGPEGTLRVWLRSPMLVFCVAFTLVFGVAVGLATTNLGTLSRYRIPLMPFFIVPLLAVNRTSVRRFEEGEQQKSALPSGLAREGRNYSREATR